MADELEQAIRDNAQQPAEAEVDGVRVKQQPLKDQIAADRYLAGKEAAKDPRKTLRLFKLVPPGTT